MNSTISQVMRLHGDDNVVIALGAIMPGEQRRRVPGDMNANFDSVVTQGKSLATKGDEIFEMFLAVASDKNTKSEQPGFGGAMFAPWLLDVML